MTCGLTYEERNESRPILSLVKAHTNIDIDIRIKFLTHDTERGSENNRPKVLPQSDSLLLHLISFVRICS